MSEVKLSAEAKESLDQLRRLLHGRLHALLGCDWRAKTIANLRAVIQTVDLIKTYTYSNLRDTAYVELTLLVRMDRRNLSRVLKGADENIACAAEFSKQVTVAIHTLFRTLGRDLRE